MAACPAGDPPGSQLHNCYMARRTTYDHSVDGHLQSGRAQAQQALPPANLTPTSAHSVPGSPSGLSGLIKVRKQDEGLIQIIVVILSWSHSVKLTEVAPIQEQIDAENRTSNACNRRTNGLCAFRTSAGY